MQHTDDDRYLLIGGRRWRATDPAIPEALAAELRSALMAGRRAVHPAQQAGDEGAERAARDAVDDAKVALGERGRAWWEPLEMSALRGRSEATLRTLLRHRRPHGSACPSDIARVVGGEHWRRHMHHIRQLLSDLHAAGEIEVLQRGQPVEPPYKGPIRFRERQEP